MTTPTGTRDKTFPYESWEDLETSLIKMRPGSKLHRTVKAALLKRGNWKYKPRGSWTVKESRNRIDA